MKKSEIGFADRFCVEFDRNLVGRQQRQPVTGEQSVARPLPCRRRSRGAVSPSAQACSGPAPPSSIGAPEPARELPVRLERMIHFVPGHNEKLRARVPDMIIQVGGSISFAPETEGAAAKWLSDDTRHMLAELEPKPDYMPRYPGSGRLQDKVAIVTGGSQGASVLGQVVPAGLGARDTLRLEAGLPLHGHELTLDITPVQARAGWAVGW